MSSFAWRFALLGRHLVLALASTCSEMSFVERFELYLSRSFAGFTIGQRSFG